MAVGITDLRNYFSRKRSRNEESCDQEELAKVDSASTPEEASVKSKAQQKKVYKARLTYRKEWIEKYPWVYCNDPQEGMFCKLCQKRGNPPPTARGAWTSRGVKDWNHATEQLREHSQSKWHRDAIIHARMAEQGEQQSVLQLQCSAVLKQDEERRTKNRMIIMKLLRSVYFLAKNHLPLTTTFDDMIQLQIENGDEVLKQHVESGPLNAQYTSNYSLVTLLDAIDTWLEKKLVSSLASNPYFSVLADECEDISTAEELSICSRWITNGKPEEHFVTLLHITATDSATISNAICSYLESKNLDYHKLVGQGYDGAATFAGEHNGVQRRIRAHSAHSIYIHCACHRLQLASIHAAKKISRG